MNSYSPQHIFQLKDLEQNKNVWCKTCYSRHLALFIPMFVAVNITQKVAQASLPIISESTDKAGDAEGNGSNPCVRVKTGQCGTDFKQVPGNRLSPPCSGAFHRWNFYFYPYTD